VRANNDCRSMRESNKEGMKIKSLMFSFLIALVGCASPAFKTLDDRAIDAVKSWYIGRDIVPPERIVVSARGDDTWVVNANPEMYEATFILDAKTMKIIDIGLGD